MHNEQKEHRLARLASTHPAAFAAVTAHQIARERRPDNDLADIDEAILLTLEALAGVNEALTLAHYRAHQQPPPSPACKNYNPPDPGEYRRNALAAAGRLAADLADEFDATSLSFNDQPAVRLFAGLDRRGAEISIAYADLLTTDPAQLAATVREALREILGE